MSQKYNIIWGDSAVALTEQVNVYLSEGWQCQGGVCIGTVKSSDSENETITTFYQAIVQEVRKEKSKRVYGF